MAAERLEDGGEEARQEIAMINLERCRESLASYRVDELGRVALNIIAQGHLFVSAAFSIASGFFSLAMAAWYA